MTKEDQIKKQIGDYCMGIVSGGMDARISLVNAMLKALDNAEALGKLIEILESVEDPSPKLRKQALVALTRGLKQQATASVKIISLLQVYLSGSAEVDAGKMANRMGRGEEALKEMLNKKMRGG